MGLTEKLSIEKAIEWGLVALVTLSVTPLLWIFPGRDAGIFLYVSQTVLRGGVPYLDAWDHKPPGIYLVNLLGAGSAWGTAVVQMVILLWSIALIRRVLGSFCSSPAVSSAVALYLASLLCLLEGGGFPESYYQILGAASLWLVIAPESSRLRTGMRSALAGICLSVSLLLKPTLIVLPFVTGAVLVAGEGQRAKNFLFWIAGALIPVGGVITWLAISGAYAPFVDAVLDYNRIYSQVSLGDRVRALYQGLSTLALSGIGLLAMTALFSVGFLVRRGARSELPVLVIAAACAFPLELFLAAFTGRPYRHYLLAVLPSAAVLSAWIMHRLTAGEDNERLRSALAALALSCTLLPLFLFGRQVTTARKEKLEEARFASAVYERIAVRPGPILIWGSQAALYGMLGRRAPTPYFFSYPLLSRGYADEELWDRFLSDLRYDPPVAVIDESGVNPLIPSLTAAEPTAERRGFYADEWVAAFRSFLEDHYVCDPPYGSRKLCLRK